MRLPHSSKESPGHPQGWWVRSLLQFLLGAAWLASPGWSAHPAMALLDQRVSAADARLLEQCQRGAVNYFVEQTDPVSGLARDRAPADGGRSGGPASIAATGFALTAWCIADDRGWLRPGEARQRVEQTMRFALEHVQQEHGWFYHFIEARTGQREWQCEVSTIDTALFLQGVLLAREYLADPEVTTLADRIYARINWRWALNGGSTLSHGWRPETGFLAARWDSYAEMLGLYLLGIGAPTQPLPSDTWQAWQRGPIERYGGHTFLSGAPLFVHQYTHAWFDFRAWSDGRADYWKNSVEATLAQRDWSGVMSAHFARWSRVMWGLTASDSLHGYVAWGGPSDDPNCADGTLVPGAPGGSLPFAPSECLASLQAMRATGGDRIWKHYGFVNAFNPQTGWASPDVIGIDLGITLLMAENLRSGFVWRHFMQAPEVRRGMKLAGFVGLRAELPSALMALNP